MLDPADSHTHPSIFESLQHGEQAPDAWSRFVERYSPKIRAWCRARGLQDADADDVTQTVLLRLTKVLKTFVYDPSKSFRAWLKTVTDHALSDFLRSNGRSQAHGDSRILELMDSVEARTDLEKQLAELFDQELLGLAMERVKLQVEPSTWDAFRLTAIEGLAGAEVAAQLGMPVASVFVAKHRIQNRIRREIAVLEGRRPG